MQIKSILIFHPTQARMAKAKNNRWWYGCEELKTLKYCRSTYKLLLCPLVITETTAAMCQFAFYWLYKTP